jgi:hypothetical protein
MPAGQMNQHYKGLKVETGLKTSGLSSGEYSYIALLMKLPCQVV